MQHQILALLSLSSYCDRKKVGEPIKISIEVCRLGETQRIK